MRKWMGCMGSRRNQPTADEDVGVKNDNHDAKVVTSSPKVVPTDHEESSDGRQHHDKESAQVASAASKSTNSDHGAARMIEVIEYIDDEDWCSDEDDNSEKLIYMVEKAQVVEPLRRQSTMTIAPHEVGIGEELNEIIVQSSHGTKYHQTYNCYYGEQDEELGRLGIGSPPLNYSQQKQKQQTSGDEKGAFLMSTAETAAINAPEEEDGAPTQLETMFATHTETVFANHKVQILKNENMCLKGLAITRSSEGGWEEMVSSPASSDFTTAGTTTPGGEEEQQEAAPTQMEKTFANQMEKLFADHKLQVLQNEINYKLQVLQNENMSLKWVVQTQVHQIQQLQRDLQQKMDRLAMMELELDLCRADNQALLQQQQRQQLQQQQQWILGDGEKGGNLTSSSEAKAAAEAEGTTQQNSHPASQPDRESTFNTKTAGDDEQGTPTPSGGKVDRWAMLQLELDLCRAENQSFLEQEQEQEQQQQQQQQLILGNGGRGGNSTSSLEAEVTKQQDSHPASLQPDWESSFNPKTARDDQHDTPKSSSVLDWSKSGTPKNSNQQDISDIIVPPSLDTSEAETNKINNYWSDTNIIDPSILDTSKAETNKIYNYWGDINTSTPLTVDLLEAETPEITECLDSEEIAAPQIVDFSAAVSNLVPNDPQQGRAVERNNFFAAGEKANPNVDGEDASIHLDGDDGEDDTNMVLLDGDNNENEPRKSSALHEQLELELKQLEMQLADLEDPQSDLAKPGNEQPGRSIPSSSITARAAPARVPFGKNQMKLMESVRSLNSSASLISLASVSTSGGDSDDDDFDVPMMRLSATSILRLSVMTAKVVKKLRERLVTAQLRQRLKDHAEKKKKEALERKNSWKQIIGSIHSARQSLRPLPKDLMSDSSTWVNNDHPYLRELKEVQAEVLPLWRKETYSYWI